MVYYCFTKITLFLVEKKKHSHIYIYSPVRDPSRGIPGIQVGSSYITSLVILYMVMFSTIMGYISLIILRNISWLVVDLKTPLKNDGVSESQLG